jgi:acyl dehydratase
MPGKFYEDLEIGETHQHSSGRTITEADNTFFNAITMNSQPLHLNEDFARRSQFGRRIVNGILTLGVVVGLTVEELTAGTIVANLGYENIRHPKPVFHGDTIYVETTILDKRPSKSNANRGIVRLQHIGRNQAGETVCEVERTVLFLRRTDPQNQELLNG